MSKLLLEISFLGTAYHGYQVQPNANTVQQRLNIASKSLFGVDCDIVGCSRTDSGVHANQFFVTVCEAGRNSLYTNISSKKIPQALSFYLPDDISVRSAVFVDEDFHARYDVKYKEYLYCIWDKREKNPFLYDRSWHYCRPINDDTICRMNQAAANFIGTHDFSSYMASNSSVKSTVRTIYDSVVYRKDDLVCFKICGDGFLYNMVRIMMGTLIYVAENKIAPEDIISITNSCDRSKAGLTAPPTGLFLNRVVY